MVSQTARGADPSRVKIPGGSPSVGAVSLEFVTSNTQQWHLASEREGCQPVPCRWAGNRGPPPRPQHSLGKDCARQYHKSGASCHWGPKADNHVSWWKSQDSPLHLEALQRVSSFNQLTKKDRIDSRSLNMEKGENLTRSYAWPKGNKPVSHGAQSVVSADPVLPLFLKE